MLCYADGANLLRRWYSPASHYIGNGLYYYQALVSHPTLHAQLVASPYGGTAHKYCIFTSRGVQLALVKSNELGISGANGVW